LIKIITSRLQNKKGLIYYKLVKNVKYVLHEIPIHIYNNLIKRAYDINKKYVKRTPRRKQTPKKYLD
tara:strand:+ start:3956 stop:4156 length:201 start_codon:yes stop_codon:yes gene_type:complete